MPSRRVNGDNVSLQQFDAVGTIGEVDGFVVHAGLAQEGGEQSRRKLPVIDMQPPLGNHEIGPVEVVGSAELTDDEQRKIDNFIDRHEAEHRAFAELGRRTVMSRAPEMYRVLPHAEDHLEEDGRYARRRFSCAGFVFEAYSEARIVLLDISHLPELDRDEVEAHYGGQLAFAQRFDVPPEALGLEGDGPWPVMMCGYLFHALNRDPEMIRREPFRPTEEHTRFPGQCGIRRAKSSGPS